MLHPLGMTYYYDAYRFDNVENFIMSPVVARIFVHKLLFIFFFFLRRVRCGEKFFGLQIKHHQITSPKKNNAPRVPVYVHDKNRENVKEVK